MLVKYEPKRWGYTPWTMKQKIAGLKINPYFVPYDWQWIGDEDFYYDMCYPCRGSHIDFVLRHFHYIKTEFTNEIFEYAANHTALDMDFWENAYDVVEGLSKEKPYYSICKNQNCVLNRKLYLAKGLVAIHEVYNHVSFFLR